MRESNQAKGRRLSSELSNAIQDVRRLTEELAAAKERERTALSAVREHNREIRRREPKVRPHNPANWCEQCDGWAPHSPTGKRQAHQNPKNGQWCTNGNTPTDAMRTKARKSKKRRSVRATSAGVPTLGKRS